MSPRRSFNWHGFKDLLDHLEAARPRITDKARLRTNAVFGSLCDAECFEASGLMRKRVFLKSPVR
jgi:hypothetical protein